MVYFRQVISLINGWEDFCNTLIFQFVVLHECALALQFKWPLLVVGLALSSSDFILSKSWSETIEWREPPCICLVCRRLTGYRNRWKESRVCFYPGNRWRLVWSDCWSFKRHVQTSMCYRNGFTFFTLLSIQLREEYKNELLGDPVISQHLNTFYDTLLGQNLTKLIEPYSRVQIAHIAKLINLPLVCPSQECGTIFQTHVWVIEAFSFSPGKCREEAFANDFGQATEW